jgi:hypothetical protein
VEVSTRLSDSSSAGFGDFKIQASGVEQSNRFSRQRLGIFDLQLRQGTLDLDPGLGATLRKMFRGYPNLPTAVNKRTQTLADQGSLKIKDLMDFLGYAGLLRKG